MASAVTLQTRITFNQLAQLTRQLSPVEKRRLAKLLEKEATQTEEAVLTTSQSIEAQLTPTQRKTWATIKQGFDELQQIREGRQKTQSADDFLNGLAEEGYL